MRRNTARIILATLVCLIVGVTVLWGCSIIYRAQASSVYLASDWFALEVPFCILAAIVELSFAITALIFGAAMLLKVADL
jgi:hypothetical protein